MPTGGGKLDIVIEKQENKSVGDDGQHLVVTGDCLGKDRRHPVLRTVGTDQQAKVQMNYGMEAGQNVYIKGGMNVGDRSGHATHAKGGRELRQHFPDGCGHQGPTW